MQQRQDDCAGLQIELEASGDKQLSTTDADARLMHTRQGAQMSYNAQVAVDAKHKLIGAEDVTNEVTDVGQLANVALEAKANLQLQSAEELADKASP